VRQGTTVHFEGDERVLIERALHRQALLEVRSLRQERAVGAVEHDFECIRLHPALVQHVAQAHTAPCRMSHRAITPLHPGNPGGEKAAAVARALVDGRQRDALEAAFEILERQLERPCGARAADPQPPGARVNLGNHRQVIAHEKGIVRRERLAQISERSLEVRRAESALDEGFLARQGDEHIIRGGACRGRLRAARAAECAQHQGSRGSGDPLASRQHMILPTRLLH